MQYFSKVLWPIFLFALFVALIGFMCTLLIRPIMIGTEYAPNTNVEFMSRNEMVIFQGEAGIYALAIIGVVLLVIIGAFRGRINRRND